MAPRFASPAWHLMACPFSALEERVTSRSYRWDNARRGTARFVIIQRTEEGCGTFWWRSRPRSVGEGEAFVATVPESTRYGFTGGAPWRFSWINLYGDLACRIVRSMRESHGPVLPLPAGSEATDRFYKLAAGAGQRCDPHDASAACYDFLCAWERELAMPPGRRDPAEELHRLLHDRPHEPHSIKAFARDASVSREHLVRTFSQRYGVGPSTLLRRLRTDHGRRLLAEGQLSVKEVALRCGFPSSAALRRAMHTR